MTEPTESRLGAYMRCEVDRDGLRQQILDRGHAVRQSFRDGEITEGMRSAAFAALFDEWATRDEELTAHYSKIMREASS